MPVIDTSVYLAAINPAEPSHADARDWLAGALARGERIAAPWIIAAEVGSAISRKSGDGPYAERVVDTLVDSPSVELVPVSPALGRQSAHIAATARLRGCDAVFVALAFSRDEPLVTLDKEQAARSASFVEVHQPGNL